MPYDDHIPEQDHLHAVHAAVRAVRADSGLRCGVQACAVEGGEGEGEGWGGCCVGGGRG